MPLDVTTKITAQSFQQCDGTNFSTTGIDNNYKVGKGSIGTYTGIGLTFDGKNSSAIVDIKGSTPYGNSPISGGFRVRHNLNEDSQSVQLRIQPVTVTLPITKKTSIYTTPYVTAKHTYGKKGFNTTVGNFTGHSTKIGKASVFVEGQIYDISKINTENASINVGVSFSI